MKVKELLDVLKDADPEDEMVLHTVYPIPEEQFLSDFGACYSYVGESGAPIDDNEDEIQAELENYFDLHDETERNMSPEEAQKILEEYKQNQKPETIVSLFEKLKGETYKYQICLGTYLDWEDKIELF